MKLARMKGRIKCFFLVYFFTTLLWSNPAWSQAYNFINYGIDEGLLHERITDVCEDQFGNLWIATKGGGISKFNGLEFENITIKDGLASNYVRDILADRKGNIWAATAEGISKMDGHDIKNYMIDADTKGNNSFSVIFEDHQSNIWFSTPRGDLGMIDAQTDSMIIKDVPNRIGNDRIIDIEEDPEGNIWFMTSIKGLVKYDKKEFTTVISNASFKGYLLSIYADDNIFWLGSNRGLVKFDITKPDVIDDFYAPLKGIFIKSVVIEDDGSIWVVSGSSVLKSEGNHIKYFGPKEGLTDIDVNVVFSDRTGSVWIGSNGKGLFKLANEIFIKYDVQHGLSDKVISSIVQDSNGDFWFSTLGNGLDKLVGDEFINFGIEEGLENLYITASCIDHNGNLWFGTRNSGLIKYDGESFQTYDMEDGLIYNAVRALMVDSDNRVWVGTINGLSIYDGYNFASYNSKNGLYDNNIWSMSESKNGKVLIATREGLNYFENGTMKKGIYDSAIFSKKLNVAIEDSNGHYWIGYLGHGLINITPDRKIKQTVTVDNGLTSDFIYNLMLDKEGDLLVGSERGLDKLFLDDEGMVKRIKNYDRVDGFNGIKTMHNSVYKDNNGDVWIGSAEGVFKYQMSKEQADYTEPITYISGLKLFYNEVDWSEYSDSTSRWFNLPIALELPYNSNNLVMEYFGASLKNPEKVNYQFRLLGLESKWSPTTERSEAVYTNLSPGEYTFEVRASNSDGIWTKVPARFKFEIVPPFWLEPWFFILLIIALGFLVKFYNDYRIRSNLNKILTIERIRSEELTKVRKKMARDFHDNMGNQLASITVFANLISLKLKNRNDEIDELLNNIEKHTKSLFNGTKDFIWSMDPESDDLFEVFTYIKDFGEDLFENTSITFYSKADETYEFNLNLPSGWSRQLVLIFKEAMTNALKHSDATELHLKLNLNQNAFVIKLWDNGKGLENTKQGKGNGFKNMSSRASQIGCVMDFESNINGSDGLGITLKGELPEETKKNDIRIY